jgi:cell wall-associated NlpC family hydrolase
MRRRLVVPVALLALVLAVPALAAKAKVSWAETEIRQLGADPASFRADDTVTRGELAELLGSVTRQAQAPVAKPDVPLTIQDLDARLVAGLALKDVAERFSRAAKDAGLTPPARYGTEVVARLLGLRKNHPQAQDVLERLPTDPASRAEAAFSAAQLLRLDEWKTQSLRAQAEAFALPPLDAWERRILATAVKLIGFPYVWGGTSDRAQAPFGVTVPGGFDCSGFVWRVYKLQAYSGARTLSSTLRGRTTYAMSAEVPPTKRIAFDALRPADLVFFGSKGPRSKPAQIDHMGIYLGSGWMIHSSRYGVALAALDGWYRSSFAWGRRPLAEAGLAPNA